MLDYLILQKLVDVMTFKQLLQLSIRLVTFSRGHLLMLSVGLIEYLDPSIYLLHIDRKLSLLLLFDLFILSWCFSDRVTIIDR